MGYIYMAKSSLTGRKSDTHSIDLAPFWDAVGGI